MVLTKQNRLCTCQEYKQEHSVSGVTDIWISDYSRNSVKDKIDILSPTPVRVSSFQSGPSETASRRKHWPLFSWFLFSSSLQLKCLCIMIESTLLLFPVIYLTVRELSSKQVSGICKPFRKLSVNGSVVITCHLSCYRLHILVLVTSSYLFIDSQVRRSSETLTLNILFHNYHWSVLPGKKVFFF